MTKETHEPRTKREEQYFDYEEESSKAYRLIASDEWLEAFNTYMGADFKTDTPYSQDDISPVDVNDFNHRIANGEAITILDWED